MKQFFHDTQVKMLHDMLLITRTFQMMSTHMTWNLSCSITQCSLLNLQVPRPGPIHCCGMIAVLRHLQRWGMDVEIPRSTEVMVGVCFHSSASRKPTCSDESIKVQEGSVMESTGSDFSLAAWKDPS